MTKALIVLTNVEQYEKIDRATGLWFGELTHFYDVMIRENIAVDFVSPKGGYVPLDPHSLAFMTESDWAYYKDEDFRNQALANSLKPSQVKADDYDIIYYTGGHGTMWDFADNAELAELARSIHQKGGIISSVCHGAAGLLAIVDQVGTPLIAGKRVAGFSNAEEAANGTSDAVPFLTQDELIAKGGLYQEAQPFSSFVVTDGRLVTGQNPQSAAAVGLAVLDLIKKA